LKYPGATHLASLVRINPGKSQVYIGNAGAGSLDLVSLDGQLVSRTLLESAPVDLAVRPEGIYVTLIGDLFPSDERNGKLVLVTETNGAPRVRTIVDQLPRPASATFADFNGDGLEDFALCSFGNYLGKFSWFERKNASDFAEHILLEQPGAVNSAVSDNSRTGKPDLYYLMAQAKEVIHRFRWDGLSLTNETLAEFQPPYGASHLEVVDFNSDTFPDLLVTNGDNGDYPSRMKNYHGVRLYLNDGTGRFNEKWFYALNGAFKAVAADFDADGDLDIAVISFFPVYRDMPFESFVYFENTGGLTFVPSSIQECLLGRWLTMDAADADNDGDIDIVLGSFADGPASVPIPPGLPEAWRQNGWAALWLENKGHAR
jgi:hypothetical protein